MAKEYLLSSVHVHTKLCDGKNTPEELALSAWKAGLKTLGFSGHSHTPHDIEYCMTNARTQLYRAQVAKLKERYAGKLDILCGLEWDLYSDDDPAAYDYWIGSTHYVKGPKTGKYYERHPVTGTEIMGFQIPLFDQALELCRTASRRVEAHLKYIGWDVAITPDGPVLVEGNNLPGYDMCQNAGHVDEGMLPRFEKLLGRPIM